MFNSTDRLPIVQEMILAETQEERQAALDRLLPIQRKLNEILKKRPRDESDFQLRIAVHPAVLQRLRTEDEKLLTEIEKRYFGRLLFRPEPSMHAEQFKIYNVATNEELASA